MARKTNGSTASRSKKAATIESAVTPAASVPAEPETVKTAPVSLGAVIKNSAKTSVNLDEEIRRRAYELYQQRNGTSGDPNKDWFIAEREVRARHAAAGH